MKRALFKITLFLGMSGGIVARPSSQLPEESRAVENAILKTKADVETSADALNDLRDRIAGKRKPLALRMDELRVEVRALRSQTRRARRIRERGEDERRALAAEADALEDECRLIQTMLLEYRRSLETRAGAAERAQLAGPLAAVDRFMAEQNGSERLAETAEKLLSLAADWNERGIGGMILDGVAVDAGGVEHKGRLAVLGPLEYFSADDVNAAGIVTTRLGDTAPSLFDRVPGEELDRIVALVQGREQTVPVDTSSGAALKLAVAGQTFAEHVVKGGVVMIPLLLLGIATAVLAVWKAVTLFRIPVRGEAVGSVIERLNAADADGARSIAQGLKEPLASLLCEGIKHRGAPREHVEEILHEHVLSYVPRVERHLGALAVFGGVAPLL